jgi:hemerythrin-like domain-containing protein
MTAEPTTHSGRQDWPRQLRLPGQVAAPEGPVDMYMMYLMHHAFRRDLTAFAAVVPHTPVEDTATWRALADRWALFADALHHHHSGEDTWLWPALLERADGEERGTLLAMEAEHEEIDPLLEASATGFTRMAAGADEDCRAALAVRLVAARESLGRHLAHEESDAMRILQAHFAPADWEELEEKFKEGITFGKVVSLVPWVLSEVAESALPNLFARTGAAHRLIWRLTRRRFARREAAAFRYAP